MQLPRLRFSLRWMMVAVAILAIAIGAWRMKLRRDEFAHKSLLHGLIVFEIDALEQQIRVTEEGRLQVEASLKRAVEDGDMTPQQASESKPEGSAAEYEAELQRLRKERSRSEKLQRKYKRAADYPWLAVEADQPEPN